VTSEIFNDTRYRVVAAAAELLVLVVFQVVQ